MFTKETFDPIWDPIYEAARSTGVRRKFMRISIPIVGFAVLGAISFSCGRYQGESEAILAPRSGSQPLAMGEDAHTRASLEELAGVIRAFGEDGAALSDDFLAQNRDTLDKLISGSNISLQELGSLLMTEQPPSLELGEVFGADQHPVATFRWIAEEQSLDRPGILQALGSAYPESSAASRAGVADSLLGFDRTVFGGNQDARIDREEADIAGIVISAIEKMDIKALKLQSDVSGENAATISYLRSKLIKQMALGTQKIGFSDLTETELRMEWMRLGLELMQVKRALIPFQGQLPITHLRDLYLAFRLNPEQDTQKLAKFYDSRFAGGNADGKFNSLEAHNLISDLRFGAKVTASMQTGVTGLLHDPVLVRQIFSAYRNVGPCLLLQSKECNVTSLAGASLRMSYFNALRDYDKVERGGNGDGRLSRVEITMALNYIGVLDALFLVYDTNRDSRISKQEARAILASMGITDDRAIDAFFAGVGLRPGNIKFWEGFTIFIVNVSGVDYLRPHEFHRRMEKILANYF